MTARLRPILHIPHASLKVPRHHRTSLLLSNDELARELVLTTDRFVDELFALPAEWVHSIIYPVSRLVADPERYLDDHFEPMAAKGMGAVYTRTSMGKRLRATPSSEERAALIEEYYGPHHQKLEAAVEQSLDAVSRALIVDCHSFASQPLPCEPAQSPKRPDLCIGTDGFHTPEWLLTTVIDSAQEIGFMTKQNSPYSGALVPAVYNRQDDRVWSVMIEVNRVLYMDEITGTKSAQFGRIRGGMTIILQAIIEAANHRIAKEI